MAYLFIPLIILFLFHHAVTLIPPKFQWKTMDFAWKGSERESAITNGSYVPVHNMPTGLARWKDKLFITIPRWKTGIPASLNYVYLNGTQDAPLHPYPNWQEGCLAQNGSVVSNRTVVSTFRVNVDKCDRLWVVDNGVSDMSMDVKQVTQPSVLVFNLKTDELIKKFVLDENVLRDSSVLTSIAVEIVGKNCAKSYAYITDMGSNAIIVYSMDDNDAWRVENHYFHFDPHAGVYKVGGIDFYWSDGVSSGTLSQPKKDGYCDLYLHPTSSTKQFRMSTRLLRNKDAPKEDIFNGVEIIGDRGPNSQATSCDIDPSTNVLFYTQVCKNGLGCWNLNKQFNDANTPLILSDCNLMEFPNDVKADREGNLWILSDRQSRFLYEAMDFDQVNFRVLTAPTATLIQGTACEKRSFFSKWSHQ
ncbi:L-dopachrome tautomerase yellow-f2-like isoform X2 [Spodoptera litura]|uniref:L-dopachrome tautomerase yellow-f2-like isoform X2 n=1 Tax=Spodoptera litura TaxID=69820 RepID=A0A9J7DQY2_SPOLT|nr:L-dopachrome tautomerase yellow-f2-like isoform X2 [Spodoptera litura]